MMPNDGKKGRCHAEMIAQRHNLQQPLTLEILSENTKISMDDLCTIYQKHCGSRYPRKDEQKSAESPPHVKDMAKTINNQEELKKLQDFVGSVKRKRSALVLADPVDGVRLQITGFSTKDNTMLKKLEIVGEPEETRLGESNTKKREFNEKGLLAVYAFVNRLERYKLGEIKTLPAPRGISKKYL